MNPNSLPNSLRAIAIAFVVGAVLAFAAPAQAGPAVDGKIVEASWPDRRVAIRDDSGAIVHFIIPSKVTIAGSIDLHRDAAAFHKHFRTTTSVRIVKGRQLRRSLFAAIDVLPKPL